VRVATLSPDEELTLFHSAPLVRVATQITIIKDNTSTLSLRTARAGCNCKYAQLV